MLCVCSCTQGMLSFSIDELSKLEQLLHVLHLPVDEASELQAGVMNRLMDVYYKLQLQANHPEVSCWGVNAFQSHICGLGAAHVMDACKAAASITKRCRRLPVPVKLLQIVRAAWIRVTLYGPIFSEAALGPNGGMCWSVCGSARLHAAMLPGWLGHACRMLARTASSCNKTRGGTLAVQSAVIYGPFAAGLRAIDLRTPAAAMSAAGTNRPPRASLIG